MELFIILQNGIQWDTPMSPHFPVRKLTLLQKLHHIRPGRIENIGSFLSRYFSFCGHDCKTIAIELIVNHLPQSLNDDFRYCNLFPIRKELERFICVSEDKFEVVQCL